MAKSLIHSDSLPVRVALQYHTRPLRLWDVLFGVTVWGLTREI